MASAARAGHYDYASYRRSIEDPRNRARRMLENAKYRARQKGQEFSLTREWVESKIRSGVCEVSGLPFVLGGNGREPFSPSLDRKDNEKGYTPENTQVVCSIYNLAKSDYGHDAVARLAEALCTLVRN